MRFLNPSWLLVSVVLKAALFGACTQPPKIVGGSDEETSHTQTHPPLPSAADSACNEPPVATVSSAIGIPRVAYLSDKSLFVRSVGVEGLGPPLAVSTEAAIGLNLYWSADGTRLAFLEYPGNGQSLRLVTAEFEGDLMTSRNEVELVGYTSFRFESEPGDTWRWDEGTKSFFVIASETDRPHSLLVIPENGNAITEFRIDAYTQENTYHGVSRMFLSPNGHHLAFETESRLPYTSATEQHIYMAHRVPGGDFSAAEELELPSTRLHGAVGWTAESRDFVFWQQDEIEAGRRVVYTVRFCGASRESLQASFTATITSGDAGLGLDPSRRWVGYDDAVYGNRLGGFAWRADPDLKADPVYFGNALVEWSSKGKYMRGAEGEYYDMMGDHPQMVFQVPASFRSVWSQEDDALALPYGQRVDVIHVGEGEGEASSPKTVSVADPDHPHDSIGCVQWLPGTSKIYYSREYRWTDATREQGYVTDVKLDPLDVIAVDGASSTTNWLGSEQFARVGERHYVFFRMEAGVNVPDYLYYTAIAPTPSSQAQIVSVDPNTGQAIEIRRYALSTSPPGSMNHCHETVIPLPG